MKKVSIIFLFIIFSIGYLFAQTVADSSAIVSIEWDTEKVRRGVVWKNAQTTLYDAPQSINIVEIKPTRRNRIRIAYSVDTRIHTSEFCRRANAIVGVNASFFDVANGGPVDYLRVNGAAIYDGPNRHQASNAALIINRRKVSIAKQQDDSQWAHKLAGDNVMLAGPMLLGNGITEDFASSSFNTTRHPRTAIAILNNGTMLLVTVDGRHEDNAAGMSIPELAYFLRIMGARHAMNLDGGGSTTMFIKNKGIKGVVNYPSDNRKFDHEGERTVATVLYIK